MTRVLCALELRLTGCAAPAKNPGAVHGRACRPACQNLHRRNQRTVCCRATKGHRSGHCLQRGRWRLQISSSCPSTRDGHAPHPSTRLLPGTQSEHEALKLNCWGAPVARWQPAAQGSPGACACAAYRQYATSPPTTGVMRHLGAQLAGGSSALCSRRVGEQAPDPHSLPSDFACTRQTTLRLHTLLQRMPVPGASITRLAKSQWIGP